MQMTIRQYVALTFTIACCILFLIVKEFLIEPEFVLTNELPSAFALNPAQFILYYGVDFAVVMCGVSRLRFLQSSNRHPRGLGDPDVLGWAGFVFATEMTLSMLSDKKLYFFLFHGYLLRSPDYSEVTLRYLEFFFPVYQIYKLLFYFTMIPMSIIAIGIQATQKLLDWRIAFWVIILLRMAAFCGAAHV